MASIKLAGDSSGQITIQAPSDAGTSVLTLPATNSTLATQNALGVRNLIINGDMRIDQRNGGASVTINGAAPYVLDRYFTQDNTDGSFTVQQSTTAPENFTNSMLVTVATTDTTLAATQLARITQRIEGNNVAHLAFGTANSKTITISFWVRSSVTGTFGGSLANGAANRSYPFSYTISSANTWEKKTITVVGDTTGTWVTNNGTGLEVNITLAAGSDYSGTSGSWSGALYFSSTGATNLLATTGATFYITGVQLEVGDTATPFEHRPYDMELARCQRYCYAVSDYFLGTAFNSSDGQAACLQVPVTMRADIALENGTYAVNAGAAGTPAIRGGVFSGADTINLYNSSTNWSTSVLISFSGVVSSEL